MNLEFPCRRRVSLLLRFLASVTLSQHVHFCHAMAVTPNPSTKTSNCAIVGVGVLGTNLCQQLLESTDAKVCDWRITGVTKSTTRHEQIQSKVAATLQHRLQLTTMSDLLDQQAQEEAATRKFDNVVFCAPPSGFDDYAGAVREAADKLWNGRGTFVFTSSGGVYASEHGIVMETSPTADPTTNPRVARLVNAEAAALQFGGCVLRLAGLYDLHRGAHNYWFTTKNVIAGNADALVNLLHYEDAANACLAALLADKDRVEKQVFLFSDGNPTTRRGICESALKAAPYRGMQMPAFGDDAVSNNARDNKSKVYDASWTNAQLSWQPKYESFDTFMASHA
ncbi:hypothetical protein MPSEU_000814200 [Mayamaea pseudoterrestris]|nr:hypothetical protein MPSEU_000814200 [Mayamaea pseudoterrestris]